MKVKHAYIIAGPNGSGKTTFACSFLPEYAQCDQFINADFIALGLSPFAPEQIAIKSGKLVLEQIKECAKRGVDFGFETTMSGVTYLRYFRMLRARGYKIHIFFLWIPSFHLAIARVKDRVSQGGHNVPVQDIKRRFERSTEKFFKQYRLLADEWILFDNAGEKPKVIAKKWNKHIDVLDEDLFEEITQKVGVTV